MTMHSLRRTVETLGLLMWLAALTLLASACSQDSPTISSESSDTGTVETVEDDGSGTEERAVAIPSEDDMEQDESPLAYTEVEADLARFIASTEAVLVGSPMGGVVLDNPETYIAIGQSACARFTQGASVDQVVADYLEEGDNNAGEQQLIGAILGSAVETICPEHSSLI